MTLLLLSLLLFPFPVWYSGNTARDREVLAQIKALYAQHRWEQITRIPVAPGQPAEIDYYRGMALARLERWDEARQAFLEGQRKSPRDKRFPLELAGIAFKRGHFFGAKRYLRQALRLDPNDTYANNFLATMYMLEDNLDAALKYWNRIDKPRIENIRMEPQPRVDPILLDRAFAFSSADLLRLPDWLTTQVRLDRLGIFPQYRLTLTPLQDGENGSFDAIFRARQRQGWGDTKWEGLLSLLRGVPYETVYPEWFNIRDSAINFTSLVRWDPQKRRVLASLSAPLERSAKWRYRIYVDGRAENWDVSPAFYGPAPPLEGLKLERLQAGAEIQLAASGHWSWETGADGSVRRFGHLPTLQTSSRASTGALFDSGFAMDYHSQIDHELLRMPERRLRVESSLFAELGRLFVPSVDPLARLRGSLLVDWLPAPHGDLNEVTYRVRAGKTFGDIPFDEVFMLGLERDNDLWLRGHVGTQEGRKGSAPLGRDFILTNADYSRLVYHNGLVKVKFGPFLDSGRIYDHSGLFGSRAWLSDLGVECRLTISESTAVVFTYGRDLRGGRNAFYLTTSH